MEANVAPEKIYVHVRANKELGTTWHGTWIGVRDIEYIRTDAFIEKACDWLRIHIFDDYYEYSEDNFYCADGFNVDKMVENFAKAMKGE